MKGIKPFISLLLVFSLMLAVVFLKMEVRRKSYGLLVASKALKIEQERYRKKHVELLSLTRPERIEEYAKRNLQLLQAQKGQVIQVSGPKLVLRQ